MLDGTGTKRIDFDRRAAEIYEQNYLLSGKTLGQSDREKAEQAPTKDGGVVVKIMWRPVNLIEATARLQKLCTG